jgi:hypothetical protein
MIRRATERKMETLRQYAMFVVLGIYCVFLVLGAFVAAKEIAIRQSQTQPQRQPPPIQPPPPPQRVPAVIETNAASLPSGRILLLSTLAVVGFGLGLWAAVSTASINARLAAATLSGASLLACGPITYSILKDLKFDSILDVGQLTFTLNVSGAPPEITNLNLAVGAEYVGCIGYFATGEAMISADSKEPSCDQTKGSQVNRIRSEIQQRASADTTASVVLIGSADRQRLRGKLLTKYDSNMGLARRRAEWVKTQLALDKVPFVVLTAGPKETEDTVSLLDLAKDRSVQVWVFWGKRENVGGKRASQ